MFVDFEKYFRNTTILQGFLTFIWSRVYNYITIEINVQCCILNNMSRQRAFVIAVSGAYALLLTK